MLKSLPMNNSKVTLELRELVENGVNIWAFEYPSFYTGEAKKALEQKVIDHYYFRQIGQETPGRFLHYFKTRVREIMPYYIARWKSVELMESVGDPFQAYDLTETYTEERWNKSSGNTTDTSSSESSMTGNQTSNDSRSESKNGTSELTHKELDTPQGNIANLNDGYLTKATIDAGGTTDESSVSSESSQTSSSTGTTSGSGQSEHLTEDEGGVRHMLTRKGNIGVQPLGQEINAYRSALINVDLEFIEALNDLFLLVY